MWQIRLTNPVHKRQFFSADDDPCSNDPFVKDSSSSRLGNKRLRINSLYGFQKRRIGSCASRFLVLGAERGQGRPRTTCGAEWPEVAGARGPRPRKLMWGRPRTQHNAYSSQQHTSTRSGNIVNLSFIVHIVL